MTAVLLWAFCGLAVAVVSPWILAMMVRRGVDAQVVAAGWAVLVSATVLVIAVPVLVEVLHRCWLVLREGELAGVDAAVAVLSAAALGFAAARAVWQLRGAGTARRGIHRHHLGLARILQGDDPGAGTVLWLPVAEPLAYSVAGQPPLVVASTGLRACLDPDALASVLAHERAHLARRHHLLVTAADAVAAGFPWLPLMRGSPALVRALVEFDADDQAARIHGASGLRRALQTLAPAPAPASALAIAGDAIGLRLARLATHRPRTASMTASRFLVTSLAAIILPAVSIATLFAVTAVAACTAA